MDNSGFGYYVGLNSDFFNNPHIIMVKIFLMRKLYLIILIIGFLIILPDVHAQKPVAFPHAEGFGRFSLGGRGGDVYHVTTIADYNPKTDKPLEGTLRHAVMTQIKPRTIVFDVSGRIQLKAPLYVLHSFLTIAGQTAPGDGITISGDTFEIKGGEAESEWLHDIIIRFIRFRHGDETAKTGDGITSNYASDYIFDHISAGWTIDGIQDLRGGGNFTLQWSIYAEALNMSTHYKNAPHAMVGSFRDLKKNISIHHNLMASSRDRHPTLGSGNATKTDTMVVCDFRNNVVYNWRGGTNLGEVRHNFVNNYYKPGESSEFGYKTRTPLQIKSSRAQCAKGYLSGNYFENASPEYNKDNYTAITYTNSGGYNSTTRAQFEFDKPFVFGDDIPKTQKPKKAFELVMNLAGASLVRDAIDAREVNDVRMGTGKLIDSQKDVGGWPEYKSKPALQDSDKDGMPDEWEKKNKLNSNDGSDGNEFSLNKNFTNLEVYLNGLVEHLYKF
jgi:hypothetical protein